MHSQVKLSQVRRFASAGSRAVPLPPSNLRSIGLLTLLLPLQPLSQFLQGMELWLPEGAGLKIGQLTEVQALLTLRLSKVPGGWRPLVGDPLPPGTLLSLKVSRGPA